MAHGGGQCGARPDCVWTDEFDELSGKVVVTGEPHTGSLLIGWFTLHPETAQRLDCNVDALTFICAACGGDLEYVRIVYRPVTQMFHLVHIAPRDGGWEYTLSRGRPFACDERVEPPTTWGVVVTCSSEAEQAELLERLTEEGHSVRALMVSPSSNLTANGAEGSKTSTHRPGTTTPCSRPSRNSGFHTPHGSRGFLMPCTPSARMVGLV